MGAPGFSLITRQADLLRFIAGFQEAHDGVSPSFSEMGAALGLRSKRQVAETLDALQHRGAVRRLPNRTRAIELLRVPAIPSDPQGAPLMFLRVGCAQGALQ